MYIRLVDHIHYPENMIHWPNVGSILGQRRRRWTDIDPTLAQFIMLTGHDVAIDAAFILAFDDLIKNNNVSLH